MGVLTLGACSSDPPGPTAAQAEMTLKADIDWLMKLLHVKDVQVTDEGGRDIPCGEGKAKRTYAITGVNTSGVDGSVNTLNMLAGGLGRRGYKVASVDWSAPKDELVKKESYVKIVTTSLREKDFILSGETECLRVS
ncbi:hypothetical protein ACFQVD_17170 [Streptosporangium amethystogenes subsp. fukuiense]|uniref:LytR/CpsA/Psr regulator C-terminal domain-containing protein n=1 Tax=Streptosporangium amethystogenes subsp. fukuiense TaxID=698418 RepID=A0ABW2T0J3_9ACTN